MLRFFRKYQKVCVIVVAFFVIVSFSFFGTFSAFNTPQVEDKEVGRLWDHSPLKASELTQFIRLIRHGVEEGGAQVNFLNDSFIHKELVLTGLAQILAEHHFEQNKERFAASWKRAKNYASYVHPYISSVSAENVWAQFAPEINQLLKEIQMASLEVSKESVALLFKLYQAQVAFPPHFLHQMLTYQQSLQPKLRKDPGLEQANLALFGFQGLEDWFGEPFYKDLAKGILNIALYAKGQGYTVSVEEAQNSLFSNFCKGVKMYVNKEVVQEDLEKYYLHQLQSLGLQEEKAIEGWQKVLTFQNFFTNTANAVFYDTLALDQFKQFAKPSYKVKKFSLPKDLQFSDFWQMIKFQRYIEIVAQEKVGGLGLPPVFCHPEELSDACPDLIYKTFQVEIATLPKKEILSSIGLKQTWDWEGKEENFAKLKLQFPILKEGEKDLSTRTAALEQLDPILRFKVDEYARLALLEEHPEWVEERLQSASFVKQELKVRPGEKSLFNGREFLALLEQEDKSLLSYTDNAEVYYCIRILEKGKGWHLLTFKEAMKEEVLDNLVDRLLKEAYGQMDLSASFEESKLEVAKKVYADLLEKVGSKEEQADEYAKHRFDGYLQTMQELAQQQPESFASLQQAPFALEESIEFIGEDAACFGKETISSIANNAFYQLIEKIETNATKEEVKSAKKPLQTEAKQVLMKALLQKL